MTTLSKLVTTLEVFSRREQNAIGFSSVRFVFLVTAHKVHNFHLPSASDNLLARQQLAAWEFQGFEVLGTSRSDKNHAEPHSSRSARFVDIFLKLEHHLLVLLLVFVLSADRLCLAATNIHSYFILAGCESKAGSWPCEGTKSGQRPMRSTEVRVTRYFGATCVFSLQHLDLDLWMDGSGSHISKS